MRRPRSSLRGITVVELAATLALLAVLVGGLSLVFRPKLDADKTDAAIQDALQIREAVMQWRQENTRGCPTLSQLKQEKHLQSTSRTDDPWGSRFRVDCRNDDVTVSSAGRDRQDGTDDDIRVPHIRG